MFCNFGIKYCSFVKQPALHKIVHHNRDYPVQNANGAEVEQTCRPAHYTLVQNKGLPVATKQAQAITANRINSVTTTVQKKKNCTIHPEN